MGFKFEKVYSGGTGGGSGGTDIVLDPYLKEEGQAADAKAVGDAIAKLESLFANDFDGVKAVIAEEIIRQIGSTPVFGTVEDDKTINMVTTLPDGVYTLNYTNKDGSTSELCTIIIEDGSVSGSGSNNGGGDGTGTETDKNNLINYATDKNTTDKYNGTGYSNDTYISSSSGEPGGKNGYVTTGFIEMTKLPKIGDHYTFYMKDAEWVTTDTYCRAAFYDNTYTALKMDGIACITAQNAGDSITVTDKGNGIVMIGFSANTNIIKNSTYFRMCMKMITDGPKPTISATEITS